MKKEKINSKVLWLTELSVLLAIIIVMGFTPIGYLKFGIVEITLITVPVIIGAVHMGEKAGTILGLAFGLTSFLQALFGMSAFGIALMEVSPLLCFLVCVPTRTLMGFLTGVVFKALKKDNVLSYAATGLIGSLMNTVFFMTTLILCYWNTEYIKGLANILGTTNVFAFVVAFVGVNGLVEAVCCTVLSAALCKALKSVTK